MQQMRILQINNLYNGAGAENIMKEISKSLSEKGYEVKFVSTDKSNNNPNQIQVESIFQKAYTLLSSFGVVRKNSSSKFQDITKSIGKKIHMMLKGFLPSSDYLATQKIKRIISDYRPDIIHIHNGICYGMDLLKMSKESGAKVYVTLHGYRPICPSALMYTFNYKTVCQEKNRDSCTKNCGTGNIKKVMEKRKDCLSANVDKIICVSDYVRNRMLDFGYNDSQLITIHNGVDASKFYLADNPSKNYVLHVGRLSMHKGSQLVLDVAKELKDISFKFIGSVKPFGFDIPNNVEFISWIEQKDLSSYYSNAIVTLAPSLRPEPHSLVPLESMMSGTPTIASNVGGNTESIYDERMGSLIEINQSKDMIIRDICCEILKFSNGSDNGEAIRRLTNTKFNKQLMIDNYTKLFSLEE